MIFLPFFSFMFFHLIPLLPFHFPLTNTFWSLSSSCEQEIAKRNSTNKTLQHFSQINVSISFNLHFWAFKKKCHEVFASQNIRQALRLTFTKKKWKLYQSDHVYHIWFCTLSVWVLIICNDKAGFFLCEL